MRRRKLPTIVLVSLALLLVDSPAWSQAEDESSGLKAAVQVTDDLQPTRAHSSPQIAANPTNGELVIVEGSVRGDQSCDVHISVDDGRSWFEGGELMQDPFLDCTIGAEYGPYATLAFSDDGTLYVAFAGSEFLPRQRDDTPRHMFVARSDDGGRTFSATMAYEGVDGNPDVGFGKGTQIAVHPTDSSKVYVGWRQGVFRDAQLKLRSNVAASTDGGRTFAEPVDLTAENGGDFPGLAVDRDGVVHAVFWQRVFPPPADEERDPMRPIFYRQSTDNGQTFEAPVQIDPGNRSAERPPVVAADPNSHAVYIAWAADAEQDNDAEDFDANVEIFFIASPDGGSSWRDRVFLNDDDLGVDQFLPGISVAPNGRVDVAWYDNRLNPFEPDTGFQDVYAASSGDGGLSFTPNVRVSDRSFDRRVGVWGNRISSNHNVGIAATDGATYFAWQDTRAADEVGQAEDVYMTLFDRDPSQPAESSDGESLLGLSVLGGVAALIGAGISLLVASQITSRKRRRAAPAQFP